MILLTGRGLTLLALAALPLVLGTVTPLGQWLFLGYALLVMGVLLGDVLRIHLALRQVTLTRMHAPQLGQFEPNSLTYRWQSVAPIHLKVTLKESGTLPFLEINPWPLEFEMRAGETGAGVAHTKPLTRGPVSLPEFRIRVRSPWNLVVVQRRVRQASQAVVVPSLGVIRDLQLWARREELQLLGSNRAMFKSQGTMFKELRPYVPGDEYRQIDWKATARRNQIVVREMEPERAQHLFMILDTGRTMRTAVDHQATRMDYAIHTALVLAYIASQRGDLVGAAAFGESLRFFAPPRAGQAQMKLLMEGLSPIQAEYVEPDYRFSLTTIAGLVRRRALIVMFTELSGLQFNQELLVGLRALKGRHLLFIVALPDPRLGAALEHPPVDEAELYRQGAIAEVLNERAEAIKQIQRSGGIVVDVPPEHLTAAVVSEYIRIKGRNLL